MEIRSGVNEKDYLVYGTQRLRDEFLIQNLFTIDKISLVYTHIDRVILGGVCPESPVALEADPWLKSEFFLERREIGVINIGSVGVVKVDGIEHTIKTKDGLYIGRGAKEVIFSSQDKSNPACFYFVSSPAHLSYPAQKIESSSIIGSK